MINKELKEYIEKNIFPKYEKYYSHGMIHINNVINNVLMLADYYNLDKNMCYVIASFHDVGLNIDRENHELMSGKILNEDKVLKQYFDKNQITIMKEAVRIIEVQEKNAQGIYMAKFYQIQIEILIYFYLLKDNLQHHLKIILK